MSKSNFKISGMQIFLLTLGIFNILLTIYIGTKAYKIQETLLSFGVIALFLGVILESYRITKSWEFIFFKFILAYSGSFFAFIPGKKEYVYNLANHINLWPYYFLFFYLLLSVIFLEDKIISKISEGYTLLLSLSFLYWMIDLEFLHFTNWYNIIVSSFSILFMLFSFAHAMLYLKLNQKNKLWLSIWSTVVLIIFGIDNFVQVYSKGDLEFSKGSWDNFILGIQYFLLGISSIYIFHNCMLIFDLLPDKSGNYREKLKVSIQKHANRYSNTQLETQNAIYCILFCTIIYGGNIYFQLIPRNILIWLVIMIFPIGLYFLENRRKKYNN